MWFLFSCPSFLLVILWCLTLINFVASAALVEKLLASFPDNVDESMRQKCHDVADENDVSSLSSTYGIFLFGVLRFSCFL